ncbi:MAG TPA: shikimate kinase [Candidatus Dojkabacteria bacterium]|jgi:shikimate kinase
MKENIKQILLHGFRATGKSTLAKLVAEKLGWEFIEMDDEIAKEAGMPIDEITKGGREWDLFRQIEQTVLSKLGDREEIVVSTGGGLGVNDVLHKETGRTFGEENRDVIKGIKNALNILLDADNEVISERIRNSEMRKNITARPVLDENRAEELMELIEKYASNPQKIKEITVNSIVEDAQKIFAKRKPLYEELADEKIDTGKFSIKETVNQILKILDK